MCWSPTRCKTDGSATLTAAPFVCTWRPCTATSPANGSPASRWSPMSSRATGNDRATTSTGGWERAMVVKTGPPPEVSTSATPALTRFDRVERLVHWTNAALFAVVMITAAALYIPFLSAYVGRRDLVKTIHVYTGLALPAPLLLGAVGRRWGR